jgi:transposase
MSLNHPNPKPKRLSSTDAFFVAYQQHAGILMQLGGEVELEGELHRSDVEQMVSYVVSRWPRLGQRLRKGLVGLVWDGSCQPERMLSVEKGNSASARWRNQPIDPFHEPPFQVLWSPNGGSSTLAFRAHHSVMDGESFVAVTLDAANFLGQVLTTKQVSSPQPAQDTRLSDLISLKRLVRRRKLRGLLRYSRWLSSEARAGRSVRLAVNACTNGNTHTCERTLGRDAFIRMKQRAATALVAPTWLCATAWMRAIHAWNVLQKGASEPLVSLEFPVSLRRGRSRGRGGGARIQAHDMLGNFISPLVLFGDATKPVEQLARELKKQFMHGMRDQSYLGTPLLTAPAKFLPWTWFRRVAVNPRMTGFATSHFTWFEQPDVGAGIAQHSNGALRMISQRIYTPVCLHMGAALAVLASPEYAQIFLTYRDTALSSQAAEQLIDLMLNELDPNTAPRPQSL